MCARMCVCVYARMHGYPHTRAHVCLYVCTCVCMHMCTCVRRDKEESRLQRALSVVTKRTGVGQVSAERNGGKEEKGC